MVEKTPPTKIASDCVCTIVVLCLAAAALGSLALNGIAGTIEAFGDAMRWTFGS